MKAETVLKLAQKTGQIITLETSRPVKVKKGQPQIQKTSIFQARVGVNYDNMQAVKTKRATGELPEENQGLAESLEWIQFPILLKNTKTGKEFLRVSKLNSSNTPKTIFTQNGIEIDRETVKKVAYASEFSERESPDCFNIDLNNIINIKGV